MCLALALIYFFFFMSLFFISDSIRMCGFLENSILIPGMMRNVSSLRYQLTVGPVLLMPIPILISLHQQKEYITRDTREKKDF